MPVAWIATSVAVAWMLTRRAHFKFEEPAPRVEWATIEPVSLTTLDNETIGGWLTRGDPAKICVLVLHGNGDSRGSSLGRMEFLARDGFGVLAISLRAHGDSTGNANDFGWSARQDVLSAVEWLRREMPRRRIAILGNSLGAAAAIFAARDVGDGVCAYVLESPYSDLKSAVWNRTSRYLPWGVSHLAYAGLVLCSGPFLSIDADRISPREHLADIPASVPVLFLAGTKDQHARLAEIKALHASMGSRSRLVTFEGASHSKLFDQGRELFVRSVLEFLESL